MFHSQKEILQSHIREIYKRYPKNKEKKKKRFVNIATTSLLLSGNNQNQLESFLDLVGFLDIDQK